MITHYIIMSSSYSKGKRIALDYIVNDENYTKLKEVIYKITKECGKDVSISTHFVQSDSKSWSSIVEKDHFFKDIEVIDTIENFIKMIKEDRILIGLDVAKYILVKVKCTHLKLEKLVYLCFAEYLCQYDDELYDDCIYAYKYGPIVKSVYEKYKGYGYKEIEKEEEIDTTDIYEMPSRSRILFAKDGEIYNFNHKSVLVIGGAYSVDKYFRLSHGYRWYESEQPSNETKEKILSVVDKVKKVDVVLSHTCPFRYIPREMFLASIDQSTVDNSMEEYLDVICEKLQYKMWYCGHYHTDKRVDNVRFLYHDIIEFC